MFNTIRDKSVDIWKFFKKRGKITYCEKCESCMYTCKQSYKIVDIMCPKYSRKIIGYKIH